MKVKKVNRYYCDYCKKAGCSGGHIAKHERGCTLNPNRLCRVCGMLEAQQVPIDELKALLPQFRKGSVDLVEWDFYKEDINSRLKALREKANNCPACIMAALRQSGIPVPVASEFSFTNEMKEIWSEINEQSMRSYAGF